MYTNASVPKPSTENTFNSPPKYRANTRAIGKPNPPPEKVLAKCNEFDIFFCISGCIQHRTRTSYGAAAWGYDIRGCRVLVTPYSGHCSTFNTTTFITNLDGHIIVPLTNNELYCWHSIVFQHMAAGVI